MSTNVFIKMESSHFSSAIEMAITLVSKLFSDLT